MAEIVALSVPRYTDQAGQPTCCADVSTNQICPFIMTSVFGTREHCFWQMKHECCHSYPLLDRRDDGLGTTIPHDQCPIWNTAILINND